MIILLFKILLFINIISYSLLFLQDITKVLYIIIIDYYY